jgi:hypothetical protein
MAGLVALAAQPGCAVLIFGGGAVAGAGMVAYARGEIRVTEDVDLSRAWSATQSAVDDLALTVVERERDNLGARLVALDRDSNRVKVRLEKLPQFTEIRIRVGIFGDEKLSRSLLEGIRQRL